MDAAIEEGREAMMYQAGSGNGSGGPGKEGGYPSFYLPTRGPSLGDG